MRIIVSALIASFLFSNAIPAAAQLTAVPTRACEADVYRTLRTSVSADARPLVVTCDLTFDKADLIKTPIVFLGSAASGTTLDCGGGTLDGVESNELTVLIQSLHRPDGSWDAPSNITIRNCTIKGELHIRGLGKNGEAEFVKRSSFTAQHTEYAQASAPSHIVLDNITFVANGRIPLYAAPGVTEMTVENSRFTGFVTSVALYLDSESARNRIVGNIFDIRTASREVLAVDGSARNRIEDNRFERPVNGGIFLYRNCGEGGTVRHQAPQNNFITGNVFHYSDVGALRPAVWLGSRQGNRIYCFSRQDLPFGSSLSPRDNAQNNTVTGNSFLGEREGTIVDDDKYNFVSGSNYLQNSDQDRKATAGSNNASQQ